MNLRYIIFLFLVFSFKLILAQEPEKAKYTSKNKGKFFIYWGGNRESYSKSDISFKGKDYNFKIYDVQADDKPVGWNIDYINPARMTIPQTNFRLGYFLSDKYSISIGVDHMKYVMTQNQRVKFSGNYPNSGQFNENPINDELTLHEDFITFEHTDGLNFIVTEFSRFDDISKLFKIENTDKFQVNLTGGIGFGLLFPKTNAKVLAKERHDDFHVSGFGISSHLGLNLTFFKHFFVLCDLSGGYIDMNSIRTTNDSSDNAKQNFFFFQRTIAFGGIFKI